MQMSKTHNYPVTVNWKGGRDGSGTVKGDRSGIQSALSVPEEFGGPGGAGTNPEELLCEAIAACYSITFGIIAANRKLSLVNIETKAEGIVEEAGAQINYKQVIIRPTITLSADAPAEQDAMAEDMAHKADAYCIITNAVRGKVEITVEPTIARA